MGRGHRPKKKTPRVSTKVPADSARSDGGPFRRWVRAKRPVFGFVLLFALLMGIFYGITFIPSIEAKLLPAYMRLNASSAAAVMNVFGEKARANGTALTSARSFSVDIAQGCDAVEPTALFIAAVLAFPASFRSKICGVFVGGLALALLNLVRIISLYYTGVFYPRAFQIMHVDVWQPMFILLALTFWIVWAWWATRDVTGGNHVPASND